ncbi:pathogenesis-related thaumatin-like protein 3.5 [Cannabis sativa]|uniref:pathogenesis-related thaumatin-like protein 3.5 n=1 Tax=Cannabis sativa TaxID=3483 RepID=UPI0029CAA23D|nr:pathogenesis-related thaumatin-like protein 3.5 [Cannabis sativa]XP_060963534.1 pathogenesis-related thaumatin-like protein 3.5 [Cannabis sativa]XP_060963535.1 pathogenesis-related thaumatin-like protein 3.5 [Cannabis sativa]XP_060963536.1 pathogenesis-related thaumatin-like protein 3.5 [Cannabis sativa]
MYIAKVEAFLCVFFTFISSYYSTFTIINNCPFTIWPGTLAGSGTPQLLTTGFRLDSGQTIRIPSIPGWSGRIWGRTGCTFDATGAGKCQTGDCGGTLECEGRGANPPTSLFEITLGHGDDKDFYDVSIVDGYNLPIVASPVGAFGVCNATGCASDINTGCPKELQVVGGEGGDGGSGVIGCKSACEAFGLDKYCCSGQFANPTTCKPSYYSTIFKNACPRAYSYAFDDGTSTFTCKAYEYSILFCPKDNGVRKPSNGLTPPTTPGSEFASPSIPNSGLAPPTIPDTDLAQPPPATPIGGLAPPALPVQEPSIPGSELAPPLPAIPVGGLAPPTIPVQEPSIPIQQPSMPVYGHSDQAAVRMVSSSNTLLPLQTLLPIVLLILKLIS